MSCLEFTIPGPAVPKARARVVVGAGGKARAFTPERTRNYESLVRLYARQAVAKVRGWPTDAAYRVTLAVHRDKVVVRVATVAPRKRATRADLDNVCKAVCDAMNTIAYADDRQVVELDVVDVGAPWA